MTIDYSTIMNTAFKVINDEIEEIYSFKTEERADSAMVIFGVVRLTNALLEKLNDNKEEEA